MQSKRAAIDVFWGEVAPCAHMVQLYENLDVLVDSLEDFIGTGLEAGEAAVVIATPVHLMLLDARLEARGINLAEARARDQYIALDAEQTLQKLLVGGWPDERRFEECIGGILKRARGTDGRKVRAFGEMVALLWTKGHHGSVVALERLWRSFCLRSRDMALFCAYPKPAETEVQSALAEIFAAHTRIIDGTARPRTASPVSQPELR